MRLQTVLHAVFPPECLACGTLVTEDFALCPECWAETPFILSTLCDQCGAPLPGEADGDERLFCDDCRSSPRPWSRGRAVMVYSGAARRLVLGLKHGDRADVARAAGPWLARAAKGILADDSLIVPVPLHRGRLLRRRFNQSALLALALSRASGADLMVDALVRTRATASLDGKSRTERFETLADAITPNARRRDMLAGRNVVVVDDVMTSGATLAAATAALKSANVANVCVMTLARVAADA